MVRLTRKALSLLTSLVLVLFWVPGMVTPASANTSGNQTLGGFEIDGNLYDGYDNTSTSSAQVAGADDWVNLQSGPSLSDPVGNVDTTTFSGSKECGTNGDCETDSWAKGTGLASPKDDLSKVFVGSRLVPDNNGDLWGYFGFERAASNGTTFFDFELNQKANTINTNGVSRPVRSPGDILIVAAQHGNNDFTISGTIQRWIGKNGGTCDSGLISTGTANGCWGPPTSLPNSVNAFYGVANDNTITDLPSTDGTLSANLFGEFAINLTAAGAVVDCPSTGFVALNVRTRSSTSDVSAIKDYATGPITIPSACGELKIYKRDKDTNALVGGATFTITPDPLTRAAGSSAVVTDNVAGDATTTGDSDPTDGIIDINPAKPGQYSVQETGPPPGYLPPTTTTQTTTVVKFGSGASAATLTFLDTQIAPSLHLAKSASPTTYSSTSDTITYTYTLTNDGNVPLSPPYAVSDNKIATVNCPSTPLSLAVGQSVTCTATHAITQANIDAGSITNLATATAKYLTTTVTSNQATATVNAVQNPALHLDKTVAETSFATVGTTLHYTYTLTNTGNVTLHAPYAVSDDKTTVTCAASLPATMAPGDSVQCTATYLTTQNDLDADHVTNVATATAHAITATGATVTSNQDTATVPAVQGPALGLTKDANPTTYDAVGDVIDYTYTLTNIGNVTLSAPYAVSDNKIASVSCPSTPTTLAPGAHVTCTASYTIKQSDLDNGSVVNLATATAKFGATTVTSNQATATVTAVQKPKLTLVKAATETSFDAPNETLHYTYTLTNSGNVTLSAPYAVADDKTANTSCPSVPTTLAPGDSVTCTATYVTTQADVDAGGVTNHATATAKFGATTVTSNQDQATVPSVRTPALHLDKSALEANYDAAGDVLHYTYTLTNSGNVTLTPPYAVSDDKTASVTCPSIPTALIPGASVQCTASYGVTQGDVDGGSVTNHATATAMFGATTVTSNQAQATVPAIRNPQLTLAKAATQTSYNAAGQTLDYTYTLTNSGNVTLSTPYAVSDDKIASVSCPSIPATLAPGDSVQCTGSYTVLQADVDAGSVTNHATATAKFNGATVTSNQAQATVPAVRTPQLTLAKVATEASFDAAGQTLHYTYTLTNSGNVTLTTPYTVTDDKTSVSCPSSPSSLAPGDSVQCTSTYTTTQADVDSGGVTNHATATAQFNGATVTSNQAQATVPSVRGPQLTLAKAATETSFNAPGQTLHYTYTLTNSGNVTLTTPYTVTDDKTSVSCPSSPSSLAPGDSVQCTSTYTTTQADVDSGGVTNHATATAQFNGATVTSNQAQATVPAFQAPGLTLAKVPAETSYNASGAVLHYTYTLTNSGNVTLAAPYAVADDKIASVSCPSTPATLAPGASVTCTGAYTTTQADVDAGSVTNHATATAKFGSTTVVSNQAQATVPAVQAPALLLAKTAAEPNYSAVGDVLHYTYTLTNVGNVTLAAPYAVSDDKTSVTCPSVLPATLAPGASVACTATYTVTQADINNGSVTNHAVATANFGGRPVTSNQDQATVPAILSPALKLVKSVDQTSTTYGGTLTYHFTVTNIGNTDLTGVVVSDVVPAKTSYVSGSASPNASFDSSSKTVSWSVGNLAAGASVATLTFKVTVIRPNFNPTVGLPPTVIDNVGAVKADTVSTLPSNHVKTPVTSVLGVKVVRAPKLPFTGVPAQELALIGLTLFGVGLILASVRRKDGYDRQH